MSAGEAASLGHAREASSYAYKSLVNSYIRTSLIFLLQNPSKALNGLELHMFLFV